MNSIKSKQVIAKLVQADCTPAELAADLGLNLVQFSRLCARPDILKALAALAHLADVRAQMLLSNFRANAAIQLIQIASAREQTELSRKACVDLLTTNLNVFVPHNAGVVALQRAQAGPPTAPTERAILRALEKLGEEGDRT